jgi:hypothetical protein
LPPCLGKAAGFRLRPFPFETPGAREPGARDLASAESPAIED